MHIHTQIIKFRLEILYVQLLYFRMCKLLLISMSISKIMNTILSALKYVISFITLENFDITQQLTLTQPNYNMNAITEYKYKVYVIILKMLLYKEQFNANRNK